MDLKVFIAAHKQYDLPAGDVYQPIHVGRARARVELPYPGDDSGVNISELNHTYCELTGLYWAWQNTTHEAYGLVHYRRYFAGATGSPATGEEMRAMLDGADVVVPRRRHYVVQTVRQHYAAAHHAADLDAVRSALATHDPGALEAYDVLMRRRSLSLYNMFLMRQAEFSAYCSWLFPVLETARSHIPLDSYGPQQARAMGYLGERLLNVWLQKDGRLRVRRAALCELERQNVVRKGAGMVGRMVGFGRAH